VQTPTFLQNNSNLRGNKLKHKFVNKKLLAIAEGQQKFPQELMREQNCYSSNSGFPIRQPNQTRKSKTVIRSTGYRGKPTDSKVVIQNAYGADEDEGVSFMQRRAMLQSSPAPHNLAGTSTQLPQLEDDHRIQLRSD
jgi:hypothetical protein